MLARAYAKDAPIYLLDEPRNNLDREGLLALVKHIATMRGRVTVINSGNGGDGAVDTFIMTANWGADIIFDFEHGVDKIDFSGTGSTDQISFFNDGAHVHIVQGRNWSRWQTQRDKLMCLISYSEIIQRYFSNLSSNSTGPVIKPGWHSSHVAAAA